jgi:hypothetical protein
MTGPLGATSGPKSLPLILAREFAANLATPMFLLDARGMLVFYNDAAAVLIGKPFMELGEIPSTEFADVLQTTTLEGTPVHRKDSPAGIAFYQRRPAHQTLYATGYNGVRVAVHSTAYPLFGTEGEMHGVFNVFWELGPDEVPD